MSSSSTATSDSFVAPDSENLKNLGPGCFVRVKNQQNNIWLEVTSVDGEQLEGVLRMQSASSGNTLRKDSVFRFEKKQINALGCDRYCYCD